MSTGARWTRGVEAEVGTLIPCRRKELDHRGSFSLHCLALAIHGPSFIIAYAGFELYEVSVFFVIKYAGDGLCLVEQWLFMLWRPNVKVRGVGRSNIECGVKTAILDSVCIVKQVSF